VVKAGYDRRERGMDSDAFLLVRGGAVLVGLDGIEIRLYAD
jgi:hypothetical protein